MDVNTRLPMSWCIDCANNGIEFCDRQINEPCTQCTAHNSKPGTVMPRVCTQAQPGAWPGSETWRESAMERRMVKNLDSNGLVVGDVGKVIVGANTPRAAVTQLPLRTQQPLKAQQTDDRPPRLHYGHGQQPWPIPQYGYGQPPPPPPPPPPTAAEMLIKQQVEIAKLKEEAAECKRQANARKVSDGVKQPDVDRLPVESVKVKREREAEDDSAIQPPRKYRRSNDVEDRAASPKIKVEPGIEKQTDISTRKDDG
ncbi:hypothetical protein TI39_contig392g00035 [Zymoseptoria brevis]|uniref:Uncharacterized protein n=1 Tax=Zymoseptoria brevis TaxID=1047168 RepID=A0A0F4GNX6_9PEZI|nr:hypothetical protein TI39_contig392g00035 [Zymoseptoria brevis]